MKKLTPTIYIDKVYNIDFQKLKATGIKMLCFDLDNTLDKPDRITPNKDEQMALFIEKLKEDFEVMIVSNNTIESRVESFASLYDLEYIEAMKKPFKKNYQHSNIIKYKKEEVIFIGDKIITDILGANRLGYKSILVDPLHPKAKVWYNKVMSAGDKVIYIFSKVKKEQYFNKLEKDGK